ncbi:MAG: glucosidase [Verrucomicrobia bacterium]|nr:glucosidase [Verrucomicrobiota bacterium]
MNPEEERIHEGLEYKVPIWRKWGAYVSERAWGTVREDYSANGDAWNASTHDMARSKAYRWGEDALCGWCDIYQTLVFSIALWNGKDPILKERLFGLNPNEGNHGEDVKEYYYYLDGVPTHSYMKCLYRYPQEAFPYEHLLEENRKRGVNDREFELIDTGVFKENRFFDITIEYAKASPEDTCIRISIINQGPEEASLTVLAQLWFRNRWTWDGSFEQMPEITEGPLSSKYCTLHADPKNLSHPDWLSFDYALPSCFLAGDLPDALLFTNNETNCEHLYGSKSASPYVKDAFHRYIIEKKPCINPEKKGTKACFHYKDLLIQPGETRILRLRISSELMKNPLDEVDQIMALRKKEADGFYAELQGKKKTEEEMRIQRQALAGLLWSTQFYHYDVKRWLEGDDPKNPPPSSRYQLRNAHWGHFHGHDILTMPDKWEYPWFASWDAAFHIVAMGLIDLPFARRQLEIFIRHQYQHPNGQIPAYEWGFSEANPPVQAWALWQLHLRDPSDREHLELCFLKLMENYSWWINKVDRFGNNIFEGGFLGLDNISIVDRSKELPGGGFFEESDGTGWMAFFTLMMMRIALELGKENPVFQRIAIVYLEHFFDISMAIQGTQSRPVDLWDEQDGFFYDTLCHPDGSHVRLKVRSFVGLIPFFSIDYFDEEELVKLPHFYHHFQLLIEHNKELMGRCVTELEVDGKKRYLLSLMTETQMRRALEKAWDPEEFLSDYGLRSLSKYHMKHPFAFQGNVVGYEPGESIEKIKGGNSNWRGPIWFPTNFLFIRSLRRLSEALGDKFALKANNQEMALQDAIHLLRERLVSLFRKGPSGIPPIFHEMPGMEGPLWSEMLLFFEHYHGDTGRGLGASHQTGWSAVVANLIQDF